MNNFYEKYNLRKSKTWAEVNLENLRHNYNCIKNYINLHSPNCRQLCVIKADAYGHGACQCARVLAESGATDFAVSSIAEAEQLRLELGNNFNILILGYTLPTDINLLIKYNITQTILSLEYAKTISDGLSQMKELNLISTNYKLKSHIKIDTGMNRLGFSSNNFDEIVEACLLPNLNMEGIFTHFACSDEITNNMTENQYNKYLEIVYYLEKKGITFDVKHVCNSAATLNFPEMHLDMVRCGLILYGLMPSDEVKNIDIKHVMSFKTVISHIHTLPKGETISYGATYKAKKDIKIATLPIGYADGFIRAFAKGGKIEVNGCNAPIVGRICMDQCMIDISNVNVIPQVGDEVIIFGEHNNNIDQLAKIADTINYEIVCLVGKRVPRFYI